MKKTTEKFLMAFALLGMLGLLAPLSVAAQDQADAAACKASPAMHHGMMLQKLSAKLNLTAEQQASAKQLFTDLHAKMQPIHQAQQQLHTELQTALGASSPDASAVGRLVIQLHQNRSQLKPVMDEYHQKFAALLTADQLATFNQLKANHSSFHHGHFDGGDEQTE